MGRLYVNPFIALVLAFALAANMTLLTGCGSKDDGHVEDSVTVKIPDPVTFAGFLKEFQAQKLPCVIPDERLDVEKLTIVKVEYQDSFVIGSGKIFPSNEASAYMFYKRIETELPFHIVSFVEFRSDGLHYHLVTIDSTHKMLDRREVAFHLKGANFSHIKNARIDSRMTITTESVREEIYVPRSEAEIRDRRNPVQRTRQTATEVLAIGTDGKFIVRQASERL